MLRNAFELGLLYWLPKLMRKINYIVFSIQKFPELCINIPSCFQAEQNESPNSQNYTFYEITGAVSIPFIFIR